VEGQIGMTVRGEADSRRLSLMRYPFPYSPTPSSTYWISASQKQASVQNCGSPAH